MRTLRQSTTRSILAELDRTIFTKYAFEAKFNTRGESAIDITFRDRNEFKFIAREISEAPYYWETVECPGVEFLDEQTYKCREFGECRGRIRAWTQRILEEISILPVSEFDQVRQLRDEIVKRSEELENPDEPFDQKESKKWTDKLEEIVKQFEKLREDNEINQAELAKIKNEVEELKSHVTKVPKKVWVRSVGARIFDTFSSRFAGRAGEGLADSLINLLPGPGNGS